MVAKKQQREEQLAELMSKAREAREKNRHLIQEIGKNPEGDLAHKVEQALKEDLQRVYSLPRKLLGPSASRRRYREHGRYSEELVTILFGTWANFQRRALPDDFDDLGVKKVQRNVAKTERAQRVMHYAEQFVKPWEGAYDNLDMQQERVTLQIGSDFHVGFYCPFAHRVWREVMQEVKPDGVRYNGDGPDFPDLSRHRQLPGHFILNLQQQIDGWEQVLADGREDAPDADHKWVIGNHDVRLVNAMADAAPVYSSLRSQRFHEMFNLDKHEVGLVCRANFLNPSREMRQNDIAQNWEVLNDADGRPFWTTVHGFLCGKDAPAKHMTKFMTFGTNGHLHDPANVAGGSLATGSLRWWQTGCMAYPRAVGAGYIQGPIESTGWAQTFNIVHLYPHSRQVQVEEVVIGDRIATFRDYFWEITAEEEIAREEMMEV